MKEVVIKIKIKVKDKEEYLRYGEGLNNIVKNAKSAEEVEQIGEFMESNPKGMSQLRSWIKEPPLWAKQTAKLLGM